MRVRFLNNVNGNVNVNVNVNLIEEVDENDVAYLYHQTRLPCAAIQSEAIFTMFEAYMKRHSLDYDPEPIDEWDDNFIGQFTSIETLNHLIMLALRMSQAALLELCQQRAAQLEASDSDNHSDGDDSDHNNDDGTNSGGDDNDHNNDDDNNSSGDNGEDNIDGDDSDHNDDDDSKSGGDDSDNDDGGNSGEDNSDGDDSDHNDDDDSNSGGDDSNNDDGTNSDEDDSDGDDSDHNDDDDSNGGNASDEVDDLGNQVQDLSDQELFVGGSHADNLSLEVSSGSSKDTNDLTPEVSSDSCSGKVDNMDSKEHLSLEFANTAGCEAVVVKRISDEGVGEGGAACRGPSRSSKKLQDFAVELHCAGVRAIKPSAFAGQLVRDATGCVSRLFGSLCSWGHEQRAQKIPDMPSRRPHKHCCKVCNKKFLSGKALGGHMSRHRHAGKQPKSTPSPPAIVVDLPVLLLGPSDEKPSPSSLESQCLRCSKAFSSCESPRGNMGMHSEKLMAKRDEEPEPAGLMEAWANANGDHGLSVMLFSPVKRKRSKRGMPVLNSEMNAGAALLMLAEHSDKTSAYVDCCGGDKDDNISTPMVLKEVNLDAFEQLDQSDEFTNSARLKTDKNPAYEGFYEHCEKQNSLNLAADAPKKEVLLNVFDYEMDVGVEFMKPGADISVEELRSGDLSAATNISGNLLRSGYALGCHMRLHCEKGNSLNLVADAPKMEVLLNVFEHGMDVDAEFMKPGAAISVDELKSSDLSAAMNSKRHQCKVCGKLLRTGQALGGHMTLHLNFEKKNKSSLVADVRKEVLLNAFDNEVSADVEWMMPGAAFSVELESSDSSAAVNVKKHQCNVCGKSLGSGRALGGHMRLHYVRKCNLHQDGADCPDSVMMEEQMQKLELDSLSLFIDGDHIHMVEDLMLSHSVC